MICEACKTAAVLSAGGPSYTPVDLQVAKDLHKDCKGGTHCDCQHKPTVRQADGSLAQRRT